MESDSNTVTLALSVVTVWSVLTALSAASLLGLFKGVDVSSGMSKSLPP